MGIRDLVEEIKNPAGFIDIEDMDAELEKALTEVNDIEGRIDYAKGKSWLSDLTIAQEDYPRSARLLIDAVNVLEKIKARARFPAMELMVGDEYMSLTTVYFKQRKIKEDRLEHLIKNLGVGERMEQYNLRKYILGLRDNEISSRVLCIDNYRHSFFEALNNNYRGKRLNPKILETCLFRLLEKDEIDNLSWTETKKKTEHFIEEIIRERELQRKIKEDLKTLSLYDMKVMRQILVDFYENPEKADYINLTAL